MSRSAVLDIEPYLYLLLTAVVFISLAVIYKNRTVDEDFLVLKLFGYLFLGNLHFLIHEIQIPIPLGLAAFLLFFRPNININAKRLAVYLGLASLILSLAIPGIARTIHEAPRNVEASGSNIFTNDIYSDWEKIQDKFDMPEDAKLTNFRAEFIKNGDLIFLSYDVITGYLDSYIVYQIDLNPTEPTTYIIRARKSEQWAQHDRLVPANKYFEFLEQLGVEKILPQAEYSTYGLAFNGRFESYDTRQCRNFLVLDNEVAELDAEQLPVRGYCISTYGNNLISRQDAENTCNYCYFFNLVE